MSVSNNIIMITLDMCSLPILLLLIVTTLARRATKGAVNRTFLFILFIVTVDTIFDAGAIQVNTHYMAGQTYYYALLEASKITYLLLRNMTSFVLMLLVYAITRTAYKLKSKKSIFFMAMPLYIIMGLLLTNPLHHLIFTITPGAGYAHGPLSFLLYAVSTAYAAYGLGYLIRYSKFISKERFFTLVAIFAIQLVAVLVQYFVKVMRFEMFGATVGCLLMVLVVLRPEEIIDAATGLLSWNAYKREIRKVAFSKHPVQIITVKISNAAQIRSFAGEEKYNLYISRLAAQIARFGRENKLGMELFFEPPENIYIIIETKIADYDSFSKLPTAYNTVHERMKSAHTTGIDVHDKILVIRYPDDTIYVDDILWLGHNFTKLMPYYQDYIEASDIVGTTRFEIENNLDVILNDAIKNNSFEMYYQPIYSVKEKRFTAAEALIRLRDEKYGMIPPGLFIPAAEANGSMMAIGNFVLESVFRFVSQNNLERMGLKYVEINLSMVQCMKKDFPAHIRELQKKYGVDPKYINFEIVETVNSSVGDTSERNIREIAGMGYKFSLDDYGTGYSNIRRISTLPLSIIKIDKSLVDNINTPDGKSIIRNTVRMMKDINKQLVVEGVETGEVAEELAAMDCDYIQGYYYSRPLPVGQFLMFISEKNSVKI